MKVTITETIQEAIVIDMPDGLDPESEAFAEMVEAHRREYNGPREFICVEGVSWTVNP